MIVWVVIVTIFKYMERIRRTNASLAQRQTLTDRRAVTESSVFNTVTGIVLTLTCDISYLWAKN